VPPRKSLANSEPDGKPIPPKIDTPEDAITRIHTVLNSKGVPHLKEMLEAIMFEFGGPEALAREFFKTYKGAAKGGMIQAKMLQSVLDLMRVNATIYGETKSLNSMTEDELLDFLKAKLLTHGTEKAQSSGGTSPAD
jgi:hypothetical protein